MHPDPFEAKEFVFEKIVSGVRVYDSEGNPLLYAEREGVSKLGKEINVYASKHGGSRILTLRPLQRPWREALFLWMPIGLGFEVVEPSGEPLGTVRRRAIVRIIRDEWFIEERGEVVLRIIEKSPIAHVLRSYFFPSKYLIFRGGERVGTFEQVRRFTPFTYRMKIEGRVNSKLLVSWGILNVILSVRF